MRKLLVKKIINDSKSKLWFRFGQGKWIGETISSQKDLSALFPKPSRNRNKTVDGYVNLKNNIEEFQRSEIPFPVGILVHLNQLQEGMELSKI